MTNSRPKRQSSKRPITETVIAEGSRAKLIFATNTQRSALFSKGMQLVYGSGNTAKAAVDSR